VLHTELLGPVFQRGDAFSFAPLMKGFANYQANLKAYSIVFPTKVGTQKPVQGRVYSVLRTQLLGPVFQRDDAFFTYSSSEGVCKSLDYLEDCICKDLLANNLYFIQT
jgi:hypothetical protein